MSVESELPDSRNREGFVKSSITEIAATTRGRSDRLEIPESVRPIRIDQHQLIVIGLVHVLAFLAFIPWFYSFTGVVMGVASIFLFALMGINIGYHRLLTHRGFSCPKWL